MELIDVITVVLSAILCGISYLLLRRDMDKTEMPFSRNLYIYIICMSLITVGISIVLTTVYSNNNFCFNLKRISLLSVLWPIGYIDFKTYRIPNTFILLGIIERIVILIFEIILNDSYIIHTLISELIAVSALLLAGILCTLCIKNSIGYGDFKLFIVMGLMLGLEGIWSSIFMSLFASFFICLFLILVKKKKRTDSIPFGPSLAIGTFISVLLTGM